MSLGNPVFAAYVVCASILVLKMAAMSWLTVYRMLRIQGGMRNPEDANPGPANPRPRPGQLDVVDYVERIRRIHQNDQENLLPFLAIGWLYVLTSPHPATALVLFYGYVASRLLHFAAYLTARPHEWRATLWTIGSLIMIGMALATLWSGLRA
ncbi:MAG: MAPEG family protein [Rubrivivax sp.]|nr:MAPEG family protein [Rubrivivax sp.]